jgi:oligoribonuclease
MEKHTNLVWIDLEMTGLNPEQDTILEIATLITNSDLDMIEIGPEIAVSQSDHVLETMNDWCKEHHGKSGLTEKVRQSTISLEEAEAVTLKFVKKHTPFEEAPLCGNSIYQDRRFLAKYMPRLNSHLHYRNIDISSVKELALRWYPTLPKFEKANKHTALEDILESLEELRYYRERLFKEN